MTAGHSFIELMTAMVSSAILLAGLAAVLMISRQIAYTPTASNARLSSAKTVNRLAEELRCAQWVMERSPEAIEFVVADRDGDGAGERIRYEWSGTPGDALERTLNGGEVVPVAGDVQDFQLDYVIDESTVQLTPAVENAEATLSSVTTVQGSAGRAINYQNWVAQQINPGAFPSIPAGATTWNATRVEFYGRRNGSGATTLHLQLRSSGAPNNGPTSEVVGTATVADSLLSASSGWNSISFASPIRGLSLTQQYNLVWASGDVGTACVLTYVDGTPTSGVLESTGTNDVAVGTTWQYLSSRYVFYRLYGTYTTAGTPVDVTRSQVSAVNVTLQTDEATHSRIEAGIPLENEPELVSAVWRADFEQDQLDPTAIDVDGNGYVSDEHDWVLASGSFNTNNVNAVEGLWNVSGTLQSQPLNDFADVTYVDARVRNGAVLRINADRQGATHGPLIVRVTTSDDEQTLALNGETAASTEKTLVTVERLATGWVRFRLLIVPQQNIVQLKVHDRVIGTYTYPTYNTATNDRFLSISGNGSQVDYVEASVADGAVVELED